MLRLETNSSIKLKKEKLGMLTLCGTSLRKALLQLRTKRVGGRKEHERREKHIGGTTKLHRPLKKKGAYFKQLINQTQKKTKRLIVKQRTKRRKQLRKQKRQSIRQRFSTF